MAFGEMTGECAAVAPAEHNMRMNRWPALRIENDIASQGGDFSLLFNGNVVVGLGIPVEIADDGSLERADRRELRGAKPVCVREILRQAMASSPSAKAIANVR